MKKIIRLTESDLTNLVSRIINEGEINNKKEKSLEIEDQFPIEVSVKERKYRDGKYYVVEVPAMSMTYDTFIKLGTQGDVHISSYDYENGEAEFSSNKLESIEEWGEKNKKVIKIKNL